MRVSERERPPRCRVYAAHLLAPSLSHVRSFGRWYTPGNAGVPPCVKGKLHFEAKPIAAKAASTAAPKKEEMARDV